MAPPIRPLSSIEVEFLKKAKHFGKPNPTEKPSHTAKSRSSSPVLNSKRFGKNNVAISVMIPISYFFGGGLVPFLLGLMGEYHSFASGIVLFGSTILGSTFLIFSINRSNVSEEPVHL